MQAARSDLFNGHLNDRLTRPCSKDIDAALLEVMEEKRWREGVAE